MTGDHSHFGYWLDMMDGKMDGLFVIGQNPAVGASNGRVERKALSKLKWLVVRDLVETETASFWLDSPEVQRGELNPDEIKTEVFLMPACGSAEKDGTFTNTQRMLQYHNKSVDPSGRFAERDLVHLSPGAAVEGKSRARSASDARAAARAHLELLHAREARGTERGRSADGDQRLDNGGPEAGPRVLSD